MTDLQSIATFLVIRPQIRQALRYRHGAATKDQRAQYERIFWRLARRCSEFRCLSTSSCLFCGYDLVSGIEVDKGKWAVCCGWCRSIGPHCRSLELAVARWNAPTDRRVERI